MTSPSGNVLAGISGETSAAGISNIFSRMRLRLVIELPR